MFELDDDDDDGFWEKLPLDEVGFESQTIPLSSISAKKEIDLPSGSTKFTPGFSNEKIPSICPSSLDSSAGLNNNNSNNTGQANRPQLVSIHNIITNKRVADQTNVASTSTEIPENEYPSEKFLCVENPLHADCLTADQTPSCCSTKPSYKPRSKRKFPGPAGILPESFPSDPSKLPPDSPIIVKDPITIEVFPSSQSSSSCDPFSSPPWQLLISDIGLDSKSVLSKFAIRSMLIKASKRILPKGKIPLVLALIDSVDFHGCDGTAVLRDPSGKVHGALHNDLVKDPSTALKAGWVIVLRQTSVISPTPRTHYLNITPANIVVIYSQTKNSSTVCKLPWSPTVSSNLTSPSTSLPSLPQIIQDSNNELAAALNHPPTPQPTPTRQRSLRTPNPSQMSLFGSISNNSPSFQPVNGFPATNPNTPVYNRFKPPIPSPITTPRMCPPASNRHLSNPLRNSANSFQSKTLTTQNRHSSTHTSNDYKSDTFHSRSSGTNHQNLHFSYSDHQTTSTMPAPVSNKTSVQTNSAPLDDFFDDDSDLLSLCDDSDIMDSNNVTLNTKKSKSVTSSHKNNADIASNILLRNKYIHSGSHQNFIPNSNAPESVLGKSEVINSAFQRTFSENGMQVTSVQLGKTGINFKDTTLDSEKVWKAGSHLKGDVDEDRNGIIGHRGGGGDRDARIQLGVSKSKPQSAVNVEQTLGFGTWDDDLDDELLSQL